jgi:hypothetical protein
MKAWGGGNPTHTKFLPGYREYDESQREGVDLNRTDGYLDGRKQKSSDARIATKVAITPFLDHPD